MALAAIVVIKLLQPLPTTNACDIIRLLVLVPLSATVYFFVSKFLRNEMIALVTGKNHPHSPARGSDN
jgi:hypothetical protein